MTGQPPPVLDEAVLEALRDSVGGDDAFVADLVETYLADSREQLAAIERAVGAGDAAALVRPAHTLKSASLTVGAMRLGQVCRELEQRARAGETSGVAGDPNAVAEEWRAADGALRDWLAGRGAAG